MPESRLGLPGWDSLLHGGLLLDGARQEAVARRRPEPLGDHVEDQLRRRAGAMLNGGGDPSAFAAFVLEEVCGLDAATGAWARGSNIPSAWGRRAITGETVKPRHLWQGTQGGSLPVFLDDGKALGIGRSRRVISQVLGWLRNGGEHLALVTNGRHWRLLFAGLDYDAWCQWDLDLWFQEGELSAQVTALRILLHPAQWTPPAKGDAPPLLQAIRDTRKGQAELSEVLGERVREAVEILIQGHGEALAALAQGAPATAPATGMFNWATGLPKSGAQTDASGAARQGRAAVDPADIYRAACRVAMRLVVILFAESRDLLPRDNALYHSAYGLQGLLEQLQSAAAGHGVPLTERHSAWPRVLALFRLVWQGSHFPELPVKDYGGELFAPAHEGRGHRAQGDDLPKRSPASAQAKPPLGEAAPGLPDENNRDGLSCALAVFENACFEDATLPDGDVLKMLELLTRTTVRVRQGRGSIRVAAPVDFSDLSSEYIGILYEGLLDYELKTAPADDPVIFLAVGDRPALPLSRLEAMNERAVKALFENLKEASAAQDEAAKDADEPAQEPPSPLNSLAPVGDPPAAGNVETPLAGTAAGEETRLEVRYARAEYRVAAADQRQQSRSRAEAWARSAAQTAGLASKHRGKITPERRLALDQQLQAKARQLIARVVLPGEWYLVRWGGTRKGSGTFYTRPGLAVPTVQRTLRPLAYDPPAKADGAPNLEAPSTQWQPKRPEQILALKLCDPACGCGTFPLAALRFLTDALYDALQHHGRIEQDGERALVRLLGIADPQEAAPTPGERLGDASAPASARGGASAPGPTFGECLGDELIPCRPEDDSFEPRLKAVLRRHVVERCIYAVDLNPLAVELCRLSLWIETMDRTLPFSFLDHKIKCGNALVGAWFDQFAHYPAMAWKHREGGDKAHGNGVHFAKDIRGKALKAFVKDRLTPDLKLFLRGADLFQGDLLTAAATAHDKALRVLADMHDLPVQDAKTRAAKYRDEFLASPAWRSLKTAMDLWCACWFWPAEELDCAPLPRTFAAPSEETRTVADRLAQALRFFHWELEFPDVFDQPGAGFDAMLGNPPWDIAKPVSKEFFSNIDPLYRSYGKQEAIAKQSGYFEDADVERDWLDYNARFRAQSNFMGRAAQPFGDPQSAQGQNRFAIARGHENQRLHNEWRGARAQSTGYADPTHPFRHQGSADLNSYKLFLEATHALLRPGGRLGFVVPSGLYSDNGTAALRRLFLTRCQWEWLFGFENREGLFPIHRSYKFNPVIVQKGGATAAIRTAFMRRSLDDWERAEALATPYAARQVARFSPKSRAILEIQSPRDLEILEKIYAKSVLLGDDGPNGWGIRYATEFHMTNDSRLFPPRPQWEAKGYRPDEYSRWLLGDWRPIGELWAEMGVDASRPLPAEVELEDWLFDSSAGPERRVAEARFVHGHLLKPGDVARTDWRVRCAQPPYDGLPVPRAAIPPGVVLSREGDAWIREDRVRGMALPLYQGIMIQPFMPSARGWLSGTGLRAKWDYTAPQSPRWQPQFLMDYKEFSESTESRFDRLKIGYRRIARTTDARTFIGAVCPPFPCGDSVFILLVGQGRNQEVSTVSSLVNSLTFDYALRTRLGGVNLSWYAIEECPLAEQSRVGDLWRLVGRLNFVSKTFSPSQFMSDEQAPAAILPAEKVRLQTMLDVAACDLYGLTFDDLRYILKECDWPVGTKRDFDARGFWRVGRDQAPELRHTVLTLVALRDAARRDDQEGSDGWLLPETLRLADYGLGHDDRAKAPQPVASRLGPRFYDWQLAQRIDEAHRERQLHARNLLGELGYTREVQDSERPRQDSVQEPLREVAEPRARYEVSDKSTDQQDIFD